MAGISRRRFAGWLLGALSGAAATTVLPGRRGGGGAEVAAAARPYHVSSWVAYFRWYERQYASRPEAVAEIRWVATHYDMVILPTAARDRSAWPAALLRAANPDLEILWYFDVRGLWSKEEKYADLEAWCREHGADVEDMFLHAARDLRLPSGTIPGWSPGSPQATAPERAASRLYNDRDRYRGYMYQMNVGDPRYQQWYVDYAMRLADSYGGVKTSGVFGDDAAYKLRWQQWWKATTVDGAAEAMLAIAEYPNLPGKEAVDAAHARALAALTRHASETLKAKGYMYIPNYSIPAIAGVEPWRSAATQGVLYEGMAALGSNLNMWVNNPEYRLLDTILDYNASGRRSFLHFRSKLQADPRHMSGYPAGFGADWPECLARERILALAEFYAVNDPGKDSFNMTGAAYNLDPRAAYWFGALEMDIGRALGPMNRKWATGRDPSQPSVPYFIWSREFERALVLVKPMPFYGSYGPEGATGHRLPGRFRPLGADGSLGEPIDQIRLRNAEAAILMRTA